MRERIGSRITILSQAMGAFAQAVAEASPCARAAVGCVLTTLDLQVLSYGYNGVAAGLPNTCLRHGADAQSRCGCVHAESNAIAKAGRPEVPKVAFITMPPCESCASLLVNAGVVLVVYVTQGHRKVSEGIENVLDPLKIPVHHIGDPALRVAFGLAKSRIANA